MVIIKITDSCPCLPTRPARCHVLAIEPGYPHNMQQSSPPISTPSSSALVDITPRSSPLNNLCAISRLSFGKKPARYGLILPSSHGALFMVHVYISSVIFLALVKTIVLSPASRHFMKSLVDSVYGLSI